MSFRNIKLLHGVQEALSLALMLIAMLVVFYSDLDFNLKIVIGLFSFTVVIFANFAAAILRQQKEMRQQQLGEFKPVFLGFTFNPLPPLRSCLFLDGLNRVKRRRLSQ